MRAAPALGIVRDGEVGLGVRGEAMPSEALALKRRRKALGHCIAIRNTARAHLVLHVERATALPEGEGPVLCGWVDSIGRCDVPPV